MAETKLKTQALEVNEAWHEVGAAGEPAFQNSWANYGSGFATAAFFKDRDSIVHIRGLIKNGSAALVFTLPVGYRPTLKHLFAISATEALGRLDVGADGTVSLTTAVTKTYVSIEVSFRAEQ